ncbi:carboxylating nicotinate-nucleotide diphosphorylase [Propionicimonas sp.]|uniref:carboxylating nicotinate-nucleotide diphosphorylase n=1 Tax=Propionicimonas sp. TaxID=1955623 RepID=UPI0017CBFA0E|nr:carboxylating nicotinate-nucleotide diphosphorylase [Propionicimonas sp.]MBU3975997.1 carboxylating nicotinate-nucleotide diphosphorylase [Actinomycetota bacterium]MBA3020811.1 carboxylating nicotinate-nucleotide diphosphorylase [Propionicimonas sp.]MBU3985187.1 carboxylating nicotinate-nucleotide diphosphorylase [Actinomycetota bacterium]MBU4008177.1 carboxylating nicotinate-nucleotide diphosphorylase [Actinomycetota bacterium]MBU4064609.1 carboxylating nicotinate-nucleotide diphosphorylas
MRSLPRIVIEPLVRAALLEDLGRAGDITTDSVIGPTQQARVALVSREPGVIAGGECARLAWELIDPAIQVSDLLPDGTRVAPGTVIGYASGPARGLLSGERVALNFLGHLSGVATGTATIAGAIVHTKARVADTRKTLPGLRALQKHAVVAGGGTNHRFGLDDAVLIKDNHVAAAGGITAAYRAAKAHVGHLVKIEVEVDNLHQLAELLQTGADAVLLDNMGPELLRQAVEMVAGRMVTEASGRITPETAVPIAEAGVDLISVGWLTHSARVLDIGLDYAS